MILKDFYCPDCSNVWEDIAIDTTNISKITLYCPHCKRQTVHESVCNGGLGKRYRFCDFPDDPAFYRGQVKTTVPTAHDSYGDVVCKASDGSPMNKQKRFTEDAREEKRDRLYHRTDKKRGRTTLTFDQKATSA